MALWDLDTMACERTCTHMDGGVKTVSISHDSQYVAYAGEQDCLVMESLQGGERAVSLQSHGSASLDHRLTGTLRFEGCWESHSRSLCFIDCSSVVDCSSAMMYKSS